MTDEERRPGLATVSRLPTAAAPGVRTRIHAVLESTDQAVYLGSRVTDEIDPHGPANRGHVTALLRASGDLLDIHGGVAAYVEVGRPRVRAARFRLHRSGPGTDPVLTDPVSTEPPEAIPRQRPRSRDHLELVRPGPTPGGRPTPMPPGNRR